MQPAPLVQCRDPSALSLQAQVRAVSKASVITAHHGTVSYIALFAREGAVLVTVGGIKPLKDATVHLWATHIIVFYLHVAWVPAELAGMLLLAQCRAAHSLTRGSSSSAGAQKKGMQSNGEDRGLQCPKLLG